MAEPIFVGRSIRPVAFGEGVNKIAIGYELYDSDGLIKKGFDSTHKIPFQGKDDDWQKIFVFEGSQFALGDYAKSRVTSGSWGFNPNLDPAFSQVIYFMDSKRLYVPAMNSGGMDILLDEQLNEINRLGTDTGNKYIGYATKISDTDVLWIGNHWYYDRTRLFRLVRVENGSLKAIHDFKITKNYGSSGFLAKTESKVYAYAYFNSYRFDVYSYDIAKRTITTLASSSVGNNASLVPSQFHPGASTESQKIFYLARPGSNTFTIEKYTLDIQANKCTKENCNVVFNGSNIFYNSQDNRLNVGCFITKVDDLYYLNILVMCRFDYNADPKHLRLYTFKFDSDDPNKLTFVTQTDLNQRVSGVIFLDSNRTKFVVAGDTDAKVYNFISEKWESVGLGVGRVNAMILDSYGRLWIQNYQLSYYMMTPSVPTRAEIKFDKSEVTYDGSPVTVNAYVSAYNFEGKRISVTADLKIISGDATFDNGSKVKTITTSSTGDIVVPIQISSAKDVYILFDYKFGGK